MCDKLADEHLSLPRLLRVLFLLLRQQPKCVTRRRVLVDGGALPTRSCQNTTKGQSTDLIAFPLRLRREEQQISRLTPTLLARGGEILGGGQTDALSFKR